MIVMSERVYDCWGRICDMEKWRYRDSVEKRW